MYIFSWEYRVKQHCCSRLIFIHEYGCQILIKRNAVIIYVDVVAKQEEAFTSLNETAVFALL